MELFQLKSFLQVAEEGSITRAAEALFITQPAVTQHIHALEKELGVALFDRTGRGVQLTFAGSALRGYARRCIALLDEGRQVIADLEKGASGRLILGAGVTTSIFHLPNWLRIFQQAYQGVDVVVRTGRSKEVAQMALDREIDLGMVTSQITSPELTLIGLFEEEIVLVAPPGAPLIDGSMDAADLAGVPLILFPTGTGFRDYLNDVFASMGISALVKMETDSLEAIKSFVTIGLGASFLPLSAVSAEIASGQLAQVPVDDIPPLNRKTSILYRTDRYLSAAARGFLSVAAGKG